MSSSHVEQLCHALANADRSGRGRPYPEALRHAVIAFAQQQRAQGMSLAPVAESLGLSPLTLTRWLERPTQASAMALFRPVSLAAVEPVSAVVVRPSGPALVVHGPAGLRIEGLDLDTLTQLVRRLA
jgi:hypothetical protein